MRRRRSSGRFRNVLLLVGAVFVTAAVGPCPEEMGPLPEYDTFESVVYGQVTLSGGAAVGAGLPVYVTPYVTGCGGAVLGLFTGDSTATDAAGRYNFHLATFRQSLPSGSGAEPTFCAEVRSAASGSADTVRVTRNITFRMVPTDSTRVDLILP